MTATHWPPFAVLNLAEAGLLPDGWQADVAALAEAPERQTIIDMAASGDALAWQFSVISGDVLRDRLGWLWALYHGALRDFASAATGQPLFASNRLSAAMTLNILHGGGATNDWHVDQNAVSGVFYADVPDGGGALLFRDASGCTARFAPRPGGFACFPGNVEHRVEPLPAGATRLAVAMVYHVSATDQPPAFGADRY